MYKLYDVDRELFFEDYKKLPYLYDLNCTQLVELRENMYEALENASMYGSALLEIALSDDIVKLQRHMAFQYILTVSPGHLAAVIGSTKYRDIDNAIHTAWSYFNFDCTDDEFLQIGTDTGELEKLIVKAYDAELQKTGQIVEQ